MNAKNLHTLGIDIGSTTVKIAILNDENSIFTVSAYLKGEYGENGFYIGVPAVVNRNGVRKIVEINLCDEEKEKFNNSCEIIKEMISEMQ